MLLSGWGGDEGATFNGRGALAEALLSGRWHYLANEFRALRRTRGWSFLKIAKGEILAYLLPIMMQKGLKRLLGKQVVDIADSRAAFLRSEVVAKARIEKRRAGPDAGRNRHWLLSGSHLQKRAEDWALMGSRYGIAVSFPMLDRRVVEFALSLPSSLFLREGWKRRVYRDAMAGVLPDMVRWRHQKLAPIPEVPRLVDSHCDKLLSILDELRAYPQIGKFFDLEKIESKLRSGLSVADASAMRRIFLAASYLRQRSSSGFSDE